MIEIITYIAGFLTLFLFMFIIGFMLQLKKYEKNKENENK